MPNSTCSDLGVAGLPRDRVLRDQGVVAWDTTQAWIFWRSRFPFGPVRQIQSLVGQTQAAIGCNWVTTTARVDLAQADSAGDRGDDMRINEVQLLSVDL